MTIYTVRSRIGCSHVFGLFQGDYRDEVVGARIASLFFKTNDKKEIDFVLDKDGELFPVEVKKSATPRAADLKNFGALDGVTKPTDSSLAPFKRSIGMGSLICMADDTFPVSDGAWAFPAWAI